MNWTLDVPDDISEYIEKIPDKELREEIWQKLEEIEEDPYEHLQKMRKYPFYKFRIKDYRGIVSMSNRKLRIMLLRFKDRNNAYKRVKDLLK